MLFSVKRGFCFFDSLENENGYQASNATYNEKLHKIIQIILQL
jgi:hypothetical protein